MRLTDVFKWLDWSVRGLLVLVLSALVILAVLVAFKMLIAAYSANGGSTENTSLALSSLGLGALVVALLSAPFVIWRSWVAHKDYKVKEQGHITDRINKAVEGLGAEKIVKQAEGATTKEFTQPNLEVRIGAIYALERIAQDSLRDHIQIMEVLSAYIRENAPISSALSHEALDNLEHVAPRVDIQAVLSVIGRRKQQQIKLEENANYTIDLNDTCLQGADLSKLNFSRVFLSFSDLGRSILAETQFHGLIGSYGFYRINLARAVCVRCSFKNLEVAYANFADTILKNSRFQNVKLSSIQFNLTSEYDFFHETFGDASVILPEGMDRPKHWPNCILGDKFEAEYKKWLEDPKSYTPPNA